MLSEPPEALAPALPEPVLRVGRSGWGFRLHATKVAPDPNQNHARRVSRIGRTTKAKALPSLTRLAGGALAAGFGEQTQQRL